MESYFSTNRKGIYIYVPAYIVLMAIEVEVPKWVNKIYLCISISAYPRNSNPCNLETYCTYM